MLYPHIIRAWTLVLAPDAHPVTFLARGTSSADGTIAAAVITPVMIAASLLSGHFSGAGTYEAAIELTGRGYKVNLLQGLVLFGAAAVIGIVAGLMGVLTRTSPDIRTATLLRSAGASPRTLIAVAALETMIYAVTTLLSSALVVAVPTLLYAIGFDSGRMKASSSPSCTTSAPRSSSPSSLSSWSSSSESPRLPSRQDQRAARNKRERGDSRRQVYCRKGEYCCTL